MKDLYILKDQGVSTLKKFRKPSVESNQGPSDPEARVPVIIRMNIYVICYVYFFFRTVLEDRESYQHILWKNEIFSSEKM